MLSNLGILNGVDADGVEVKFPTLQLLPLSTKENEEKNKEKRRKTKTHLHQPFWEPKSYVNDPER